jgi:hypothetical protein
VLCWVVVKYCELAVMYKVIYFLFVFLSCEYDYGFSLSAFVIVSLFSDILFLIFVIHFHSFLFLILFLLFSWLISLMVFCDCMPIVLLFCYIEITYCSLCFQC